MGDDLIAARHFCLDADQHLAYLSSGSVTPRQTLLRLSKLEKSADHIQARAIVREIRHSIDSFNSKHSSSSDAAFKAWIDDTVLKLTHLIRQYQQGLIESTPQKIKAKQIKEAVTVVSTLRTDVDHAGADQYMETHRQAQNVLRPLLKFAENDRQYSALSKLAAFTARRNTSAHKTTGLESQANIADDIDLAAIVPALSNAALGAARRTGKIVSLSYDCENITIPHANRSEIEAFLATIGESLVEHVLEWPNVRQARGQSGAGHISLNASQVKSILTFSFECPGTPITVTHFKAKKLSSKNYAIALRPENNGQRLTLTLTPKSQASLTKTEPLANPITIYTPEPEITRLEATR